MTPKSPAEKKYRVIQWGVGNVGTIALRHFVHNPAYELVGVLCNRPEKVGKDAGELCGKPPTGVLATDDKGAIEALDADCVFYAPLWSDPDEVCRLLRREPEVLPVMWQQTLRIERMILPKEWRRLSALRRKYFRTSPA